MAIELGATLLGWVISKGCDAGLDGALARLKEVAPGDLPANHHVAKALHKAYRQSLFGMAEAIGRAAEASTQSFADAFKTYAGNDELQRWSSADNQVPFTLLEERTRHIYRDQDQDAVTAATDTVIAVIEAGVGETMPRQFREIFHKGLAAKPPLPSWSDQFELFFGHELKTDPNVFNITSSQRLNEIVQRSIDLQDQIAELIRLFALGVPISKGIRPLLGGAGAGVGFKQYLHSGKLAYVSRAAFVEGKHTGDRLDEDALASKLLSEIPATLLIAGPGGVGKTRLALELGRRLEVRQGWLVRSLDPRVTGQDIEGFVRQHGSGLRVVFLLDYAEIAQNLDHLILTVEALNESGFHVALIVTCRASAIGPVRDALDTLHPSEFWLGSEEIDERAFQAHVVREILSSRGLDSDQTLVDLCVRPFLAAFAVFLHDVHPDRFEQQFRGLQAIADFEAWMRQRLRTLIGGVEANRQLLADIALALPMDLDRRDALLGAGGQLAELLRKLEEDQWVEVVGQRLEASHDVLADGIAAAWVFEKPGQVTNRLEQCLLGALDQGTLQTALVAADRLAAHEKFEQVDGERIMRRLLTRPVFDHLSLAGPLLNSRLMAAKAKLGLLGHDKRLSELVGLRISMRLQLARLLQEFAFEERDKEWDEVAASIIPLIDESLEYAAGSNRLIRRAYRCFPLRYRAKVLESIERFPKASQTHFLIAEFIRQEPGFVVVRNAMLAWLEARGTTDPKASFIFTAWIDAKGDTDAIEQAMLGWLETFVSDERAHYVLAAWFNKVGNPEAASDVAARWLDKNGESQVSGLVLSAWLRSGVELPQAQERVLRWLELHGYHEGAIYVALAWKQIGGDVGAARDMLLSQVDERMLECAAWVPLVIWMKLGLPVEGLGGRLGRWFELHGEELEAPHLLSAWFDATTDCGEVVTHARRWLGRHETHLEARFVLASWIYRLDDVGEVAPYVDRWTGKNGTCHEALLVFCAWYHNGGDQGRYRDLVLALIEQFPTSEKAWFLTKFASGWRDLPERSIRAICSMCRGFRNDPDSLWRTSRLCWHISQDSWDLAREIIRTALDCLEIHCADGQLMMWTPPH